MPSPARVSKRGRVRKEPERLEAGPASIAWTSESAAGGGAVEASSRKRSKKLVPTTPRKSTTPEGFLARQLATSELNDRQMELLGLYTKMFPIQASEDPDFMIETVATSTSFVIRHGKTRQVVAGISFKTFANQKMATVEYITTTVQRMGHGTVRALRCYAVAASSLVHYACLRCARCSISHAELSKLASVCDIVQALLDTLYDHMQQTKQHEGMMLYACAPCHSRSPAAPRA